MFFLRALIYKSLIIRSVTFLYEGLNPEVLLNTQVCFAFFIKYLFLHPWSTHFLTVQLIHVRNIESVLVPVSVFSRKMILTDPWSQATQAKNCCCLYRKYTFFNNHTPKRMRYNGRWVGGMCSFNLLKASIQFVDLRLEESFKLGPLGLERGS